MKPVLGIRIGTRMFLGLPVPDPDPPFSQGVERTEIKIVFFASLKLLKTGVGSGSGSISQRYGSADPDPHHNVWMKQIFSWSQIQHFSCRTQVLVWGTVTKSVSKAQYMILQYMILRTTVESRVPDPNPDLDPPDSHVFGLPDPDPLVRGMDPDPDPSIILLSLSKIVRKP
jgi:hypothetical protein